MNPATLAELQKQMVADMLEKGLATLEPLALTQEEIFFASKVAESVLPLMMEQWFKFHRHKKLRPKALSAAAALILIGADSAENLAERLLEQLRQ